MATILEVHTSKGTTRRCDASCHHAKSKKCGCICGGEFHGKGGEAESATWERLNEVRSKIELEEGEHAQLRIGA